MLLIRITFEISEVVWVEKRKYIIFDLFESLITIIKSLYVRVVNSVLLALLLSFLSAYFGVSAQCSYTKILNKYIEYY